MSSDSSSDSTLSLTLIKTFSIFLLIIICVVLGLAPFKWSRFKQNPGLVAYSNSFSAGLFLGMGILHLLFESLQDYQSYMETQQKPKKYYPVPLLVAIISFSLVLFLEKIVFYAHELIHPIRENESMHIERHKSDEKDDVLHQPLFVRQSSWPCDPNQEEENFKKMIGFKEKVARTAIGSEKLRSEIATCMDCQVKDKRPTVTSIDEMLSNNKSPKIASKVKYEDHEEKHGQNFSPYPILLALSIHGAFEGVAVGIQTSPKEALNLVFAVLLHKWAEALTLGIALYKGNVSKTVAVTQIIILALAGPTGIIAGWILVGESLLVSSIFKAISAGTFLYVSATELIVEEFSISSHMFRKYLLYLLGIALMSLILLFE